MATPAEEAVTVTVFEAPAKVPLAPLMGAVKVTIAPLTGVPPMVTVPTSGAENAVLIAVLCDEPLVGVMIWRGLLEVVFPQPGKSKRMRETTIELLA